MRSPVPDPAAAFAPDRYEPVTQAVAARGSEMPAAAALASGSARLSYLDLWERAVRIAGVLAARGVRPGEVVGITGQPSFGLVAALLGALEAGATILPIDPSLPPRRRHLLLAEARAERLVSAGHAVEPTDDADVVVVDSETCAVDGDPTEHTSPKAEDPAYVFFTSGTTGTPRAIVGRHEGLSHFVAWQRGTFGIDADDRVALTTSLSFDVVLRELFVSLTSGATLCLPGRWPLDPSSALAWLLEEDVTVVHAVPTLTRAWLRAASAPVRLPELRLTFFAGEPLGDALVRAWRERLPPSSVVVNLYGPTETTLAKSFFVVPDDPEPGIQPLGRPLPATQLLVVDHDDHLCGVGEPGEIVVRTPFRTDGYLNTDDPLRGFRPNPFTKDGSDLVYYSGDVGQYRYDGLLEILGRLDEQVKVRGVRIDPGSVQAALERHPSVRQAAVVVSRLADEPTVSAYVVPTETAGPRLERELRIFLFEEVAPAAVPAAIVRVESLPVTPNGKLDVAALPQVSPEARDAAPAEQASDELEEQIRSIWQDVLAKEAIGLDDDFFDIGGDSLAAIQVAARLSEESDWEPALEDIFMCPTIRELALQVRGVGAREG